MAQKSICRFCGERVERPCRRDGSPLECPYTDKEAHRQEPRPATKRDAEWAVIARAAELAEYVKRQRGAMRHVTEVRLIEAVDDYRQMQRKPDAQGRR